MCAASSPVLVQYVGGRTQPHKINSALRECSQPVGVRAVNAKVDAKRLRVPCRGDVRLQVRQERRELLQHGWGIVIGVNPKGDALHGGGFLHQPVIERRSRFGEHLDETLALSAGPEIAEFLYDSLVSDPQSLAQSAPVFSPLFAQPGALAG